MQRTPLYDAHLAAGGRMVDFSGWEMPIHYGSQIEEHHQVRRDAGMFDVSHMTVVDVLGANVRPYLARLLANDISRLVEPGKALYSCMLNEDGGVIDDLIVYFFEEDRFRLVVNAGTRDKDMAWLQRQAQGFSIEVLERPELAMIAVQGPAAREKALAVMPAGLSAAAADLAAFFTTESGEWLVARTGYTGEDGFEISLPAHEAAGLWQKLLDAGVKPCGLGARDTLRLEAGLNLYGHEMDETVSPLEAGLGWTVAMKDGRNFIGRQALQAQKDAGLKARLVGLVLEGKGILRQGQTVTTAEGSGIVTSGGFSPTLERAIAFARIPLGSAAECTVEIRGKQLPARIVKPPFVRNGQACKGIL